MNVFPFGHRRAIIVVSLICVVACVSYGGYRVAVRAAAIRYLKQRGGVRSFNQIPTARAIRYYFSGTNEPAPFSERVGYHYNAYLMHQMSFRGEMTDEMIATIVQFPELRYLTIACPAMNDQQLERLRAIDRLVSLDLRKSTSITDSGVCSLERALPQLEQIYLTGSGITDTGVRSLAKSETLQELDLENTSITDASVDALLQMKRLRILRIKGSQMTDEGRMRLRRMPGMTNVEARNDAG